MIISGVGSGGKVLNSLRNSALPHPHYYCTPDTFTKPLCTLWSVVWPTLLPALPLLSLFAISSIFGLECFHSKNIFLEQTSWGFLLDVAISGWDVISTLLSTRVHDNLVFHLAIKRQWVLSFGVSISQSKICIFGQVSASFGFSKGLFPQFSAVLVKAYSCRLSIQRSQTFTTLY